MGILSPYLTKKILKLIHLSFHYLDYHLYFELTFLVLKVSHISKCLVKKPKIDSDRSRNSKNFGKVRFSFLRTVWETLRLLFLDKLALNLTLLGEFETCNIKY